MKVTQDSVKEEEMGLKGRCQNSVAKDSTVPLREVDEAQVIQKMVGISKEGGKI